MHRNSPVWLDRGRPEPLPALDRDVRRDVVVVGAGITGLLTALLLARSGRSVVVLEGRRIGDGTTGHTTGKVSLLQGTRLGGAMRHHPPSAVGAYVEANREGQAWLRRFCADHGVAVQDRPAYTYATTRPGELRARAELAAAQVAGLGVTWELETELPVPVRGTVRLADQFQLDPLELLEAALARILAEGAAVHEDSRVRRLRRTSEGVELVTDQGTATAPTVVLATGQPIADRGGFFARLEAQRSYAAALTSPWVPHGMYLSSDRPTRSVRSLPVSGGEELLLVGGNGHVTGRVASPADHRDELVEWARSTFAGSAVTHTWSAQDQSPVARLPYVGPLLPRDRSILVATGFDKWGLTNAPAAALLLAKTVLGEPPSWRHGMSSWTPREVLAAHRALLRNAAVGVRLVEGYARRGVRGGGARPPLCTHLGGVLRWNDAECSWDCPLHGSRFATDGTVLEGPATRDLRQND